MSLVPLNHAQRRGVPNWQTFLPAVVVVAAISYGVAYAISNGSFDFLWRSTGWDLSFSVIPFNSGDPYWRVFAAGLVNTILLGAISLAIATIIGVIVGALRTSGNAAAELFGTVYVELFRNVPLLLHLLFWYKILTMLPGPRDAIAFGHAALLSSRGIYILGLNINGASGLLMLVAFAAIFVLTVYIVLSSRFDWTPGQRWNRLIGLWAVFALCLSALVFFGHRSGMPILDLPAIRGLNIRGGVRVTPEFLACIIAISIYGSAYIAEIVRAGFDSIDAGITEAGRALGLKTLRVFLSIRLPLAVRAIMPTLTNQYVWLLKATTIGIAVGFADFFLVVATAINQSGQTFQIIAIFMATFLILNYLMASGLNRINAAIALKGDQIRGSGARPAYRPLFPRNLEALHRNYFSSVPNALLTLVLAVIAAWILWHVVDWAFVSAVWGPGDPTLCKAPGAGACWMVIVDRWRLILFGLYPAAEQWRSALGCAILMLMAILTCVPRFWSTRAIVSLWLLGFGVFYILMRGGMLGLVPVLPQHWGGLALTLFVFASVVVLGMPLAIVLALLRRSAPPAIARATGILIDAIRSLPLLSLLYTAAVIVPLALPDWLDTDKLYRVVMAFALFFACYQAEVLRGGFQSLPKGQDEAGMALGMNFRHRMAKILLPQVFKLSLPPTINQLVITFKETSLIVIIGFFEILASGSAAFGNAKWSFAYIEVYVFIGAIYFAFVFSLSRYGALLERRMSYGG